MVIWVVKYFKICTCPKNNVEVVLESKMAIVSYLEIEKDFKIQRDIGFKY